MTTNKNEDEFKIIFSRNLKKLMSINNVTQKKLVSDLGINKSTISSWVTGARLPRMDMVQLLADYFNVNRSDLIEDLSPNSSYIMNSFKSSEEQQYLNKLIFNPINWNIEEKIDGNYLLSNLKTNATCEITQSQLDYLLEQFIIKNIDVMKNFIYDLTCGDLDDLDEDNSFNL